jgi:tetratricopeptide (TPR) repeat protein
LSFLQARKTLLFLVLAFAGYAQQSTIYSGYLYTVSGKPSITYQLELQDLRTSAPVERTVSSADGKFEFPRVTGSGYTVVVKNDAGEVVGVQDVSRSMGNPQLQIQIVETSRTRPVPGMVSVSALRHHAPRKAIQEMNSAIKAHDRKDPDAEERHLLNAIHTDPEFSEAHTNLGSLYTRSNRIELGYREFDTALKLGPRDELHYCNLAVAALALNRDEEAESEVRLALQVNSRYPQANFLLGRILAVKPGRDEEAVRHLRLAASDISRANVILAQLYARTGRNQDAIAALEQYEQVNPNADRGKIRELILSLR